MPPMTDEEQLAAISERAERIGVAIHATSLSKAWILIAEAEQEFNRRNAATANADAWQNANDAIFGQTIPDLRPLTKLLLDYDRPIPAGTRNMLALMLDPDSDGYLYHTLTLSRLDNKRRGIEQDLKSLDVANEYALQKRARVSDAAEKTIFQLANRHENPIEIEDRSTVFRHVRRWHQIRAWLRRKPTPSS